MTWEPIRPKSLNRCHSFRLNSKRRCHRPCRQIQSVTWNGDRGTHTLMQRRSEQLPGFECWVKTLHRDVVTTALTTTYIKLLGDDGCRAETAGLSNRWRRRPCAVKALGVTDSRLSASQELGIPFLKTSLAEPSLRLCPNNEYLWSARQKEAWARMAKVKGDYSNDWLSVR